MMMAVVAIVAEHAAPLGVVNVVDHVVVVRVGLQGLRR